MDIYALGIILFEALCGARPAQGSSEPSSDFGEHESIAVKMAELLPEAPEGLRAVVCKALSPRPEDRFDSADELARALAPFAGRRGTHDPALRSGSTRPADITLSDLPSGASLSRGAATGQRRQLWVWAALGIVVALGVAVFAFAARAVERAPSGAREPPHTDGSIDSPESPEPRADLPVASGSVTPSPSIAVGPAEASPAPATRRESDPIVSRPTTASRAGASLGTTRTEVTSGAARSGRPSASARPPARAPTQAAASAPTGFDPESPYAHP